MFLCLFVIHGVGLFEIGGFTEMYKRSSMGDRLQFFDFRFDFTTRFTFWNTIFRGIVLGLAFYGTNQALVQRALSMSTFKRAQTALQWSILLVSTLFILCIHFGLVLYAVFYQCDPVLMKSEDGITKYDQLVPYFIISRLQSYPGLTGLCFAGIFSSSLSTISSALNSLAIVTIIDFIQPIFSKRLNPKREEYLAKGLSLFYGVVCILLTYSIAGVDSIAQATSVFMSVTEGPVLAVFLIGVLTRKATDKVVYTNFCNRNS
ncbi:sodium-coupled monocarboxylate transporter 2 [Trichonephila clavipes]|nr:sodium-coupled monocarboxylate transporter 2 [Trichonephila clavipes]